MEEEFLVMNYKRLLRLGSTVDEAVEPAFHDECNYLTQDEVTYLMTELRRLQDSYFPDIPMADSLKHAKRFLYNIPRNIFNLIKKVNESGEDEILSPLYMIYPLLAAGMCTHLQRIYLERLSYSILDTNDYEEEGVDEDE